MLTQGTIVTVAAGTVALLAFFAGQSSGGAWFSRVTATRWGELMKFWWWPGLAFAATYYLVLLGGCLYMLKRPMDSIGLFAGVAGMVGGLMGCTVIIWAIDERLRIASREPYPAPCYVVRS